MKNSIERWRQVAASRDRSRLLKSRRGMTLFEVMIVIAIIVMVMGALLVGVMSSFNQASAATTELTMGKIDSAIQTYTIRHKKPPTTSQGLKAVFTDERLPTDSWGNEFVYTAPGPGGMPYEILSYGRDGAKGGSGSGEDIKWSEVKNR
jgi:general secretion pathway protein G